MTPYSEGMVSITKGSDIIEGHDTYWERQVRIGDKFIVSQTCFYIVTEILKSWRLRVHTGIQEESAGPIAYIIARDSAEWGNNIDIAQDITDLLGKYQLGLEKATIDAQEAQDRAEIAQGKAEEAQAASEAAAAESAASAQDSDTAKSGAETALANAEKARDDARLAKSGAETAQGFAEGARDRAVQAEITAVSAKNSAVSAAGDVDEKTTAFDSSLSTAKQALAAAVAALQQIQQAVEAGDPTGATWVFLETQLAGALYYDRTNNVIRLKGDPLIQFSRQNHYYGTGEDGTVGWHLIPGLTATDVSPEREEDYLDTGEAHFFACIP